MPTKRKKDLLSSARTTSHGTGRATRRAYPAVPASVELPAPPGALGPRFPAQPQTPGSGADTSARYIAALEEQIRGLTDTVRSLEQQIATVAQRNRELEASHMQLATYRAESDREVAERAAATIRDAEIHAGEIAAAAELRAAQVESEARARSLELIEAVGAEIDALEREAAKVRRPAGSEDLAPAPGQPDDLGVDAATAASIRGQISDLLKLRESIVQGIRGAVAGFAEELDRLERPPLAAAADPDDEAVTDSAGDTDTDAIAVPGPDGETPPERNGFTIVVQAEPVAGVLEASRIEQNLAEISAGADAHLRSVEGGAATLSVWGLTPQELREAIDGRFPGASCEWVADDRVTIRLAPAEAA